MFLIIAEANQQICGGYVFPYEDERFDYRHHSLINRAEGETNIDYHLGSSWIGSRLWASEQVSDVLTLCRGFGRPSLFITVTTNPNWPEIKERLYIYVKIMMDALIMAAYYADHRGKRSNHNLNIAYRPHSTALMTLGLLNRHRFNVIYLTTQSV
jgi:hypothetical protein